MRALVASQPDVEFPVELEQAQVDAFWADGFLAVGPIAPEEEIEWLRAVYDHLFAEKLSGVPGGYFDLSRPYDSPGLDHLPQVLQPELLVPSLHETACVRNGRRLAARILGAEQSALQTWGHMILKPARVGAALPWHQDEAYWHPGFEYRALGVWLPLDAASAESACMAYVRGSHTGGVRRHAHIDEDASVHGLYTDDVDASGAVSVPAAVGSAVLHHCRTLHSSLPNRSAHARRAWANEFQRAPVRRATTDERPWLRQSADAWARRDVIASVSGR